MNKNRQTTPIILKKIFKLLLNPKKLLYKLSQKYIRNYEGFSYEVNKNGEGKLSSVFNYLKMIDPQELRAHNNRLLLPNWNKVCLGHNRLSKIDLSKKLSNYSNQLISALSFYLIVKFIIIKK